jgi:alkanesulfonate monooxygenase SsuD/methylene tetrahydromethanopterin reductase-like flavin-dependent oxidoreductase (luciferase family)
VARGGFWLILPFLFASPSHSLTGEEGNVVRIGLTLYSTSHWPDTLAAAQAADASSVDAIGFGDRYHSEPGDPFFTALSAYGALAAATRRVHLVPMVFSRLNYPVGRLAKESAILARISEGRFELGLGAGDYPREPEAWGEPYPDAIARVEALGETVAVLRRVWTGESVTFKGKHVQTVGAGCLPAPPSPPPVVVGAGASRRLIRDAVRYADEVNVFAHVDLIDYARGCIRAQKRDVVLSAFVGWDRPLADIIHQLDNWRDRGVTRAFFAIWHPFTDLPRLIDLAAARAQMDKV